MSAESWMDHYPGVKRLLQREDDELLDVTTEVDRPDPALATRAVLEDADYRAAQRRQEEER